MDEAERRAERQLRQLDVPPGPCGLSVWSAAGAGHTASPGAPWEPLLGLGLPPLQSLPCGPTLTFQLHSSQALGGGGGQGRPLPEAMRRAEVAPAPT